MIAIMWFMGASDVKYGYRAIAGMVASSKEACRNFRGQYGYPFGQSILYAQFSILTYLALTLKLSSIIVVFGW